MRLMRHSPSRLTNASWPWTGAAGCIGLIFANPMLTLWDSARRDECRRR
jgi:hypothetical protein